ncbi:MAG: transglutaminase TgpA family protein [Pyrinomonadaceae bacterium]
MIACGVLALAFSGGLGIGLAAAFFVILAAAWKLEGKRWQFSERVGLVVVLLSLPLFYVDWKLHNSASEALEYDRTGIGALIHFTLFLSSVKLLQVKADRDWLFLYLLSFFQILLSAGLSVSPLFIATLGLYLFCSLQTFVCFELRKARRSVPQSETRLLGSSSAGIFRRLRGRPARVNTGALRKLPLAVACLLALIFSLALPIFFITPRSGSSALALAGGGATGYVGFSDQVTLGDIGRLQQNDRVVMRVRVDDVQASRNRNLRWRGVALDHFSGRAWRRSSDASRAVQVKDRDLFQVGTAEDADHLTTQTFFLEPIDTPVLFAAPHAIALQGSLPFVRRDDEGAWSTRLHPQERVSYRAYSDTVEPPADILREDSEPYSRGEGRHLQLPRSLDTRIGSLAWLVTSRAGARNRYDAARAIEAHLNNDYGYTLEMRAGGEDPLADFLFNVRAGHCEYFATAMVVMLRTQGIAARVVNGFQKGEYNDAADAYIVRQRNAHSWVEVYFPQTDSWVTFDPTPPAGRSLGAEAAGLGAQLGKYAEALELFWIQYVVAYDRQEQRTLANSLRGRWGAYRGSAAHGAQALKASLLAWWAGASAMAGGPGALFSPKTVLVLTCAVALALSSFALRLRRRRVRRKSSQRFEAQGKHSAVTFYERMCRSLEARGMQRASAQTPLEFAAATGMPEALVVTRAYHRVRYGAKDLSPDEAAEVESCLRRIEAEVASAGPAPRG